MWNNIWTTFGGIAVFSGYIVGVVVNPMIGEALKAGGTVLIGLAAKDSEKVKEVSRNLFAVQKGHGDD